ncbi:FxLD family lantipeptide [Streptomyces sp. NA02950]|uniref:FxLD family lanthipeptide n=1 Tax=Streptomyces sp. NA02950 TaxID=2742137 RepID=UPI001590A0F1|nr:FxLD family lanthipeptide [Streptomyces sp. NA02950]QKV95261.1 FxLD family lantipeptide [Streptomyces sp. NA02950]
MTTAMLVDGVTALAEPPVADLLDDDFQLDVRVVIAEHPGSKLMCATSDGCGNTCANGASSCNSYIEDPS